jgi:hypothetical protein
MNTNARNRTRRTYAVLWSLLLVLVCCIQGVSAVSDIKPDPEVYLDFNEGSGIIALDASGHGNAGTITGPLRTHNSMCGEALLFNGSGEFVSIPYTTRNHPAEQVTVSTWFYVDSFDPQTLVSGYNHGGYWLGFGDGNDLWWVVNTEASGVIAVPVQHDGITLRQWHHVTGTYDGEAVRIYLDGSLRNRVNATGPIHYEYPNYVMLGADAGTSTKPDTACSRTLRGGLDEVRIYDTALTYTQVMDDRFRCTAEPGMLPLAAENSTSGIPACMASSGYLRLNTGESAYRTLTFPNISINGTWIVSVPPGSKLIVKARDLYSASSPDSWYVEIADGSHRVDRSIAFPNTNNAPVEGVIPSGNATVFIRYFDGDYRFPASAEVLFECVPAPPLPVQVIPPAILANPGIVIYSASWATLIAVLVVVVWMHRRKTAANEQAQSPEEKNGTGSEIEERDR